MIRRKKAQSQHLAFLRPSSTTFRPQRRGSKGASPCAVQRSNVNLGSWHAALGALDLELAGRHSASGGGFFVCTLFVPSHLASTSQFHNMVGKLPTDFSAPRHPKWTNFLPIRGSVVRSMSSGNAPGGPKPNSRDTPVSRRRRWGCSSAGAATSTPGMRRFEPSGFVCRAGTCPLAQRSACASRRFAAAGGSRKKPSRALSA